MLFSDYNLMGCTADYAADTGTAADSTAGIMISQQAVKLKWRPLLSKRDFYSSRIKCSQFVMGPITLIHTDTIRNVKSHPQ